MVAWRALAQVRYMPAACTVIHHSPSPRSALPHLQPVSLEVGNTRPLGTLTMLTRHTAALLVIFTL